MVNVDVNWLGVVLATAASMIVGTVWYARGVFGNLWIKLAKVDEKKMGEGAGRAIGITVVVSFMTAFVLAHVIFLSHNFFHNSWLQDALTTSVWVWLGFVAARFITHDVFESRPEMLTLLTVAHELVTLVVMGLLLGIFHP